LGGLFVLVTIFLPKGVIGIQLNRLIKNKQTAGVSEKSIR